MARTLQEIYTASLEAKNQYLQLHESSKLKEVENSSKMSVLDAITWITSASIWAFEKILDVFKIDIANDLQNRINGTPLYYANALLKYQTGGELKMSDDGTQFYYAVVDKDKRIITKVSYEEFEEEGFHDKQLLFKIATGDKGNYDCISGEELMAIRSFLQQISFAGTHINIVSRKGDILIPRVTVYYDGSVSSSELLSNLINQLDNYVQNLNFNGAIYVQKIIDVLQNVDHVTDVYISSNADDNQGVFIAQYDDDNNLIPVELSGSDVISYEKKINRKIFPNSGFLRQSSKKDAEAALPTWSESIVLKVEE